MTSLALAVVLLGRHRPVGRSARTDGEGNPLPAGALFRLGSVRWRHGDGITNSALSPDGKLLARLRAVPWWCGIWPVARFGIALPLTRIPTTQTGPDVFGGRLAPGPCPQQ